MYSLEIFIINLINKKTMKKLLIILITLIGFTSCVGIVDKNEVISNFIDNEQDHLNNYIKLYIDGSPEIREYIDSLFIVYKVEATKAKKNLENQNMFLHQFDESISKMNKYLNTLEDFEKMK